MEAHVHVLEEESLEKVAMIQLLTMEVDSLKEKICHCNEPKSRPLSGAGTAEDPFELKYALESEYIAPLVVTTLVLIKAEEVCDPS